MKALRLEIFQETACYKKPFAFKALETYPLPPYSTVKGMLHSILKAEEYIPMKISIAGDYESIFNSYNTMRFYKKDSVTSMPINTNMLLNVSLIIHINASDDILEKLINGIENSDEYFSLGRREDLAYIKDYKIVELRKVSVEDNDEEATEFSSGLVLKNNMYIPKMKINKREKLSGINYRLNFKYDIVNKNRNWQKIDSLYVEKGSRIHKGTILIDEKENAVYFNN